MDKAGVLEDTQRRSERRKVTEAPEYEEAPSKFHIILPSL